MLSYEQAAEVLGVSPRTVRRLVKSGELPAARIGASVRIRPEVVRAYVLESEQRMSDVSSSLVGVATNDFLKGGSRPTPTSVAFPGNGAASESGPFATGGQAWQGNWQATDAVFDDEPVTGVVASGRVSGGIIASPVSEADPFPGARPPGTQGSISPTAPGWFVDQQSNATDYDVGPNSDLSSPTRPWSSGPRPSDVGFTQAFYPEQSGQTQLGAPDSTGTTGPRRLRRDNGAPGVLP
jgi:excisionase family DNA binding protein